MAIGGVGVLATEFDGPKRMMKSMKESFQRTTSSTRQRTSMKKEEGEESSKNNSNASVVPDAQDSPTDNIETTAMRSNADETTKTTTTDSENSESA